MVDNTHKCYFPVEFHYYEIALSGEIFEICITNESPKKFINEYIRYPLTTILNGAT